MKLDWLGRELGVSPSEAETLAVTLILDGRLSATVDQVAGTVTLTAASVGMGTAAAVAAGGGGAALSSGDTSASSTATGSASAASGASPGGGGKYAEITRFAHRLQALLDAMGHSMI